MLVYVKNIHILFHPVKSLKTFVFRDFEFPACKLRLPSLQTRTFKPIDSEFPELAVRGIFLCCKMYKNFTSRLHRCTVAVRIFCPPKPPKIWLYLYIYKYIYKYKYKLE